MRNAGLEETDVRIEIAGRKNNNLRYPVDTSLVADNEEDLKNFLLKVKEESEKAGLLLNIKNSKIMSTGNISGIYTDGEEIEAVTDFIFLGSKINMNGNRTYEINRLLVLGRMTMGNLDNTLKFRHIILPRKVRIVKAMVFSVVTTAVKARLSKKLTAEKIDGFELWC